VGDAGASLREAEAEFWIRRGGRHGKVLNGPRWPALDRWVPVVSGSNSFEVTTARGFFMRAAPRVLYTRITRGGLEAWRDSQLVFFLKKDVVHRRHSQHTYIHPYEYTYVKTTASLKD
jgi:hypothetical protein